MASEANAIPDDLEQLGACSTRPGVRRSLRDAYKDTLQTIDTACRSS